MKILLPVTVIIIFFSLGKFIAQSNDSGTEDIASELKGQSPLKGNKNNGFSKDQPSQETKRRISVEPANSEEMERLIDDLNRILNLPQPVSIRDSYLMYHYISKLNSMNLSEVINYIRNKPNKNQYLLAYALNSFGQADPENTLKFFCEQLTEVERNNNVLSLACVFYNYGKMNPDKAYSSLQNSDLSDSIKRGVIRYLLQGSVSSEPQQALELLKKITFRSESEMRDAERGMASGMQMNEDFILFAENDYFKERFKNSNTFLESWARKFPREASDWVVANLSEEKQQRILRKAIPNWARDDIDGAYKWFFEFKSDQAIDDICQDFVHINSFHNNPVVILDWLTKQKGIDQQKQLMSFFKGRINFNPSFVADKLEMIQDTRLKTKLAKGVYKALLEDHPDRAKTFLESSPYLKK